MTDEEKVTNGRNSRGSQQLPNDLAATEVNIPELSESIITTAEEKLQDVTGNLILSPEIEPSIYQTGVVAGSTTTAKPTTTKSGAAASTTVTAVAAKSVTAQPSTPEGTTAEGEATAAPPTPEPGQVSTDGAPTETEPTVADQTASPPETQADPAAPKSEPDEPKPDETEGSPKPEGAPDETVTPTTETAAVKADLEREEKESTTKSPSVGEVTTSTTQATTEPPPKDPYQIDIPIEKKINKRTQRKLWEEIEKRKPLIPKYVERHIQKYAKPPFELWGCKSRGKGSCYGCG